MIKKNSFNNYYKRTSLSYNSDKIFSIAFDNIYTNKIYYITFDSKYHTSYYSNTFNFTVLVYSTIYNSFIFQSLSFSGKKSNYLFYISQHSYYKYYRFGFKRMTNDVLGELQIFNINNNSLVHQEHLTDYFEYYFYPESTYYYKYKYIANLTLTSIYQNTDSNKFYLYFFQSYKNSDDTELMYYINPQNDTKEFIVLSELNLLLDISIIPALSKVYFGYNWEYSLENSIKAYGFSEREIIYLLFFFI